MIKICIADNHPVVIQGIKSFFSTNSTVEVVASATNFDELSSSLQSKAIKENPDTKIILFTAVSEKMYAPTAIKAGVSAYLLKTNPLKELEMAILKVNQGIVIFSEAVKRNIDLLNKGKKTDRLYKKLSSREVEVLRYLNDGKKNKEIAEILTLDEKTISTYKLRLLAKLNVTNLVDLLTKAKSLDII